MEVLVPQQEHDEQAEAPQAHAGQWLSGLAAHVSQRAIKLSPRQNFLSHVPKGLVVIAKDVVDQWNLSVEWLTMDRSVIVVQGGLASTVRPAPDAINLEALPVSAV